MKKVSITRGMEALVDDEDYENISSHKWWAQPVKSTCYAARTVYFGGKKRTLYMHRCIINAPEKVDHIDGNGLNNRKENLRAATHAQNLGNQKTRTHIKTSKYKGVCFISKRKLRPWRAHVKVCQKRIDLGHFSTEKEAAVAYNNGAAKHFGVFARLNVIS